MDERPRDRDDLPDDDEPQTVAEEAEQALGAKEGTVGAKEDEQSTGPGGIVGAGGHESEGHMT